MNANQQDDARATPTAGTIGWRDLTVPDAERVRDFYARVIGWKWDPVDIGGGFSDFNMLVPATGEAVAGVCWARGVSADLPPQWLVYVAVDNLAQAVQHCVELGGRVVAGPRKAGGGGNFCVIQDPAGAVCALYTPAPAKPSPAPATDAKPEEGLPADVGFTD